MARALNVNDLIVQRSDRSGVDALTITIHRFPANASSVTPAQNTYTFWYRPRTEKGETWITVPELGLHHHHITGEMSLCRHRACRSVESGKVPRA